MRDGYFKYYVLATFVLFGIIASIMIGNILIPEKDYSPKVIEVNGKQVLCTYERESSGVYEWECNEGN